MPSLRPSITRAHGLFLVAVLAPVLLQLAALFNPDMVTLDCEERYNAGHAIMLLEDHADAVLRLQYRRFCGGCTFTAVAGAGVMSLAGTSWLAWKGVALLFTAMLSGVGTRLLERQIGRAAAVAWVVLLCLAPLNWVRLNLISWGNHVEAGVWAVCILALVFRARDRRWHLATGALCGGALWFGFSSVFVVLGAFAYRAFQRRWRDLGWMATGALLAPVLWALQWLSAGQLPFGTIYFEDEFIPLTSRIPDKLASLFAPQQLAGLWGLPDPTLGVPLGVAWTGSILGAVGTTAWAVYRWRRDPAARPASDLPLLTTALIGVWLGLYMLVGFSLQLEPWPTVAGPTGLRYAAPLYPIIFLLLAATVGRAWSSGRRRTAVLLMLGPVASGLLARAATLSAPFPDAFPTVLQATDTPFFRQQAAYVLQPAEHAGCTADSDESRAVHAYGLGRQSQLDLFGEVPLDGVVPDRSMAALGVPGDRPPVPWYEGVGGGLIDNIDGRNAASITVLRTVHDRLTTLPGDGQQLAIDEALWRRVYYDNAWSLGRGQLTGYRLRETLKILDSLPSQLREGWLRAYGRRWGRVHARLALPTPVPFPTLPLDAAQPFAHGLGQGLGAEWGPRPAVPSPVGMPAELDEAFLDGYTHGTHRQWRQLEIPTVDRTSTWADAEADRWWGPPATMTCPCGATCE